MPSALRPCAASPHLLPRAVRLVSLVAIALLAACGNDEDDPADKLIGTWYLEDTSGYDCGSGVTFGADGQYEILALCSLTGGGYGAEMHIGTYEVSGDEIHVRSAASSCPGERPESDVLTFDFEDGALRLVTEDGVLLLERLEDDGGPPGSAAARFGCYASDGSFLPHEIERL